MGGRLRADSPDATRSHPHAQVKLIVVIIYTKYNLKTKREDKQKRMVVMEDAIKWEKFTPWVTTVLGLKPAAKLNYAYVSNSGTKHAIESKTTLQAR